MNATLNRIFPTRGKIVIRQDDPERQTASGIYLTHDKKPNRGTIMAVGRDWTEDGKEIVSTVHAGDRVIYQSYGGTEIEVNDEKYMVLTEREVLVVLKP